LLKVVDIKKDIDFILKLSNKDHLEWIKCDLKKYCNLKVEYGKSLEECAKESEIAIAASGTVILELALLGLPTIVVYNVNKLNYFIARLFYKGYAALPNIAMGKEIFPELLQEKCNAQEILKQMNNIKLNIEDMHEDINKIRKTLSGKNIVQKYAEYILKGKSEYEKENKTV
ncbi:MAG: lipid-A-disaccharide synthase, partial [Fusobacteriaceae bacterium]